MSYLDNAERFILVDPFDVARFFSLRRASRVVSRAVKMSRASLIGVIGDEDTCTGFLLAGVGERNAKGSNFLVVTKHTPLKEVEAAFKAITDRDDVAILLINQNVANDIRHLIDDYKKVVPTLLEIPSKEHPYDPSKDSIMRQVNHLLGSQE